MLFLMQADPTGLSTPLGRLVIIAILLTVVVTSLRFLWHNRRK